MNPAAGAERIMPVFIYRCRDCRHSSPLAQESTPRTGRCEMCGGRVELARENERDVPDRSLTHDIAEWLRLRDAWLAMAETWYAWRASRTMLEWYRRVRSEDSGLTGRKLYEHVIMRRSGLDGGAATAVVRHAEESFCSWPTWREPRYRDVVLYVVVYEYLRSHKANLSTHTRMETTVARVIPNEL